MSYIAFSPEVRDDMRTNFAHTCPSMFVVLLECPGILNNADRAGSNWSPHNHDPGDEQRS